MNRTKWDTIRQCVRGEEPAALPVALIVDSPWIPGHLGISTLDYMTVPEVWLEANLRIEAEFPGVIFLPGFWAEIGMCAEPSAFGCKVSFHRDRTPVAHPLARELGALEGLKPPDVRTDGLMPLLLNLYRRMRGRIEDAGHIVPIVAARGPLTVASHLLGVTDFLLGLKLESEYAHRLLRTTTTLVRDWLAAQAEALGTVEGILVLDDIAGFLSPEDYLEFAHPYLEEIFGAWPGVVRMFHNDTVNPACYRFLSKLGIDIFNFTHLQALGKVRNLVGPDMCLLGNVPPLEVLAQGTPEQVRAAAAECLRQHPSRRRFILSAGGGTSPGTPGANIAALLEAARAAG